MGIHYDYKSKRGERAMLKEAKRKARLAQRRAKKMLTTDTSAVDKEEIKYRESSNRELSINVPGVITLVTARLVKPLEAFASSTCSQMATL